MLDEYVYRNLKKYGNCVIGIQDLKKYGKKKILEKLKEQDGEGCIDLCDYDIIKSRPNIMI